MIRREDLNQSIVERYHEDISRIDSEARRDLDAINTERQLHQDQLALEIQMRSPEADKLRADVMIAVDEALTAYSNGESSYFTIIGGREEALIKYGFLKMRKKSIVTDNHDWRRVTVSMGRSLTPPSEKGYSATTLRFKTSSPWVSEWINDEMTAAGYKHAPEKEEEYGPRMRTRLVDFKGLVYGLAADK